jgi:hypothetical protein
VGRIDPGSGSCVFTGQAVLSIPALIAFTSARLSFEVRPFTEGTVIGGSLAPESFPVPDTVLDAVLAGIGDAATATGTICGVVEAICASVGIASPPGEGRASLVAAQASAVPTANMRSMGMDDDLWETYCISSTEELLVRGVRSDLGDLSAC